MIVSNNIRTQQNTFDWYVFDKKKSPILEVYKDVIVHSKFNR